MAEDYIGADWSKPVNWSFGARRQLKLAQPVAHGVRRQIRSKPANY
jgi:hypothetical protein